MTIILPLRRRDLDTLPKSASIFLYGTGAGGRGLRRILEGRHARSIAGFLDGEREGEMDGLPVLRPETLVRRDSPDLVIVVASQYWPQISERLSSFREARLFNGYFLLRDEETHERKLPWEGVVPLRILANGTCAAAKDARSANALLDSAVSAATDPGTRSLLAAVGHAARSDLFFAAKEMYAWLRSGDVPGGIDEEEGPDGRVTTLRLEGPVSPERRYADLDRSVAREGAAVGPLGEAAALALSRLDARDGRLVSARRRLQTLASRPSGDSRWAHLAEDSLAAVDRLIRNETVPPALAHLVGDDTGHLAGRICAQPFKRFDVQPNGDVEVCCHHWLPSRIGNIYTDAPEDIINSPTAVDIRRSMLDGSYKYCVLSHCAIAMGGDLDIKGRSPDPWAQRAVETGKLEVEHPHTVLLAFDQTCNLSCPSCRRERIVERGPDLDMKIAVLERGVIPLLKNAERLYLNTAGEVFAGKSGRWMLGLLNRRDHPRLLVDIISNGMMFSREEWARFPGLHDMIGFVRISIDAARRETFETLRRGGKFDTLRRNMEFLAELRRSGVIPRLATSFTYQVGNFREMPEFADWCRSLAVDYISFEKLEPLALTPVEFARGAVHLPDHPDHGAFLEVLRHPSLQDDPPVRIDFAGGADPSADNTAGELPADAFLVDHEGEVLEPPPGWRTAVER